MKEITEKSLPIEVELSYEVYEEWKLRWCEQEINVPRRVISAIEKKVRLYEVDDIKDLERNYDTLTKTSRIPLPIWSWLISTYFSLLIKDKNFRREQFRIQNVYDKMYKDKEFLLTWTGSSISKFNFNIVSIDNVFLRNINIIKNKSFEASKFDIKDRHDRTIEGIFVYHHVPSQEQDELSKKQLEEVLTAYDSTKFDLQFIAFLEYYNQKRHLRKRLLIHDIRKNRGKSYQSIDVPYNTSKSPIFHMLFK
jgi:hypothetical protein